MSFVSEFNALPLKRWLERSRTCGTAAAREASGKERITLADFADLISPAAAELLEPMGRRARHLTQQRFGKVIRLFAPLYLSNECINNCNYCGFSRDNPILRVTLSLDEVLQEARALQAAGFPQHPARRGRTSEICLHKLPARLHRRAARRLAEHFARSRADGNRGLPPLVAAGADGLVVYQETYDREVYADMHTAGPKRNFDWRLETPERAYAAGFRRLGISPLYGLADWRFEALSVAAHADYLLRNCWKAELTISLPRLRPCAGEFQPLTHMTDRELAQLVCALRLMFPDVGLVLSTRESAKLRDGLIPLGITMMSAGSHTEPGGYTGAGKEKSASHRARPRSWNWRPAPANGRRSRTARRMPPDNSTSPTNVRRGEVADVIRKLGYEPVWKDWDAALTA